MHSPDSKPDYYFGVVGKHYPSLIWQETGNYSPLHHLTLCKVQSADSADSRGFLLWSASPCSSVKQKQAALAKLVISTTQQEVGNNRNIIITGQNGSVLHPDSQDCDGGITQLPKTEEEMCPVQDVYLVYLSWHHLFKRAFDPNSINSLERFPYTESSHLCCALYCLFRSCSCIITYVVLIFKNFDKGFAVLA